MSTPVDDYIVIGSGFGGSVSACRLAEKGYSVRVIEQGKRKRADDFPKSNWNVRKYLWAPLIKCFGVQKMFFFKDVLVLGGVGVGGGSLVYANTHMTPDKEFFKNPAWSHIKDWEKELTPFYRLARFMLGTTRYQKSYAEDEFLRQVAKDMGQEDSYRQTDVGVYFGEKGEDTDPYFGGKGPKRNACVECAGCMVGCRYNAKNTLDKNYLWFAEQNGAEITPETKVTKIEHKDGLYHIHTVKSTAWFRKKKKIYRSKGLVVSAGVLGTLKLLMRQKLETETLPDLSDTIASNVRTNSETITGAAHGDTKLNNGIAISSVFQADEHTHIEICKYPNNSGALGTLAIPAVDEEKGKSRSFAMLVNLIRHPSKAFRWMFNPKFSENSLFILVMQSLESKMKMVLKKGIFGSRLKFDNNGENKIPAYIQVGQEVTRRLADKTNGIALNSTLEIITNMSTTAHILGGCPMGETKEEGMVNEKFEVHGYPNMYVLDGSIIPCNLGVNPSLTITTLSEYAMSHIPAKKESPKHIGYENLQKKENSDREEVLA